MEEFKGFAFRCDNWVIWNIGGWSDGGWIGLCVTPAKSSSGVRRSALRMGWNGVRFSAGKEIARLREIDPDAEQVLQAFLARALPCPMVTA